VLILISVSKSNTHSSSYGSVFNTLPSCTSLLWLRQNQSFQIKRRVFQWLQKTAAKSKFPQDRSHLRKKKKEAHKKRTLSQHRWQAFENAAFLQNPFLLFPHNARAGGMGKEQKVCFAVLAIRLTAPGERTQCVTRYLLTARLGGSR